MTTTPLNLVMQPLGDRLGKIIVDAVGPAEALLFLSWVKAGGFPVLPPAGDAPKPDAWLHQVVGDDPGDFYVQDSRGYVGNDMSFWANGGGYTTSLDDAEVFTRESAFAQRARRPTDIPWPAAYLRSKSRPAVDFQYVSKADAEAFVASPPAASAESRYTGVLDDPKMQELFSSTILGALAFGAQGTNPPPAGHWLTNFWNIGRTSQPSPAAVVPKTMDVFNRAARDLPKGWRVIVELEKDAGSVSMTDNCGDVVDVSGWESETMDWQIDEAVRIAIDAAREMR